MTSIEDTFSSDSSSSSFSSLSTLTNNLQPLNIEVGNDKDSAAKESNLTDTTELADEQKKSLLKVPRNKANRLSVDSTFYANDINYGENENKSLENLKKFIIKRNLKTENPDIEFNEKLNKPILEFFDLETNSCRANSLVIDYSKKNQVINYK